MVVPIDAIAKARVAANCPACQTGGKPVKEITVSSLVKPERRAEVEADAAYFFCGSADCDVVYFDGSGERTFSKADLTVRVGIKEKESPRPVCYCFSHTIEEIYDEIGRTGRSTVPDDIRARMKSEGCSCETKSPVGSCCLSTVQDIVDEAVRKQGVEG